MRLNFSKSRIFLASCISFIIGIAIASFVDEKWLRYDLWFFGVMVGLLIFFVLSRIFKFKFCYVACYVIFLLTFFLGIWRYSIGIVQNTPDKIWFYNGQYVEFTGVVNREPDVRTYNTKLTLETQNLASVQNQLLPVQGNVLVTTKSYPEYHYGDKVEVKCKLQEPEPFQEFAYDRYLARHNVFSLCYYPQIALIEHGQGNVIFTTILKLKNELKENINYGLLEPEASLLQAITLGNRRGLSQELLNKFSQAGISHIIAISGMHIAIISVIIMNLLLAAGVSRRWSFILAAFSLLSYIILIGVPPSAMRAGLMAFLALLAIRLGRLSKLTNSLVLAACALLLINPKMLRDDIGFQLSFLAVLSIVYLYPIIDKFFDKVKVSKFRGIRDIVTVTLSAQVLTLPVIMLNFHQVSLVSPLVNVLVLFLLPFIMVSGMLAAVISFLSIGLAWLFFTPAYFMLKYLLWIVDISVKLPFAYIEVEYIWVGWVILFYVVVGYGIWWYTKSSCHCERTK